MVFTPDSSYPIVNTEKGILRLTLSARLPEGSLLQELSSGTVVNMVPPSASAILRDPDPSILENALQAKNFPNIRFLWENGTLSVTGKAAHASMPELGESALTALFVILQTVLPQSDPAFPIISAMCNLIPHGEHDGSSLCIAASDEISGSLTVNLGLCSLENGVFTASFDVRSSFCVTEKMLSENLKKALRNTPFTLEEFRFTKPHHVPENHPLIKALQSAYIEWTGKSADCICVGGITYVHDLEGGVAFGPEYPGEHNAIHAPDEFIQIDHLIQNAKMYVSAILNLQK